MDVERALQIMEEHTLALRAYVSLQQQATDQARIDAVVADLVKRRQGWSSAEVEMTGYTAGDHHEARVTTQMPDGTTHVDNYMVPCAIPLTRRSCI